MFARLFAGLALVAGLSAARADEKLKTQAAEAMKKADVADARVVETEHLVVATTLPEPAAKKLADGLEKVFAHSAKALKLEPADTKTQMTVFTFADPDAYKQFQRAVLKQRPDDQLAAHDVKRDDPFVVVSTRRGERNPSFEALAGTEISRALLAKKGGSARLPEWMKDGFAKAVGWRLNPSAASAERSAVARLAPALRKGAKGIPVADKAWSGTTREKDAIAASLMDFFTSGPGAEKFTGVLTAMIPTEAAEAPAFAQALMAASWPLEELDREWREWVAKGSPVAAAK